MLDFPFSLCIKGNRKDVSGDFLMDFDNMEYAVLSVLNCPVATILVDNSAKKVIISKGWNYDYDRI